VGKLYGQAWLVRAGVKGGADRKRRGGRIFHATCLSRF